MENSERCHLRIVAINDVYELDNFSHFASAKRIESEGPNVTIGTLAGDFVAPSLLSSLDHGHGKVDCMNSAGIDYVCIGNHENDIALDQLFNRMRESKFKWINSNMELHMPEDIGVLPDHVVLTIPSADGTHERKVALIGLNTNDPSVYPPSRFGGCVIHDLNDSAADWYQRLMAAKEVDTVIPLTHQLVSRDRELAARKVGFPVIIGGHDHMECLDFIEGCYVVKTSMDILSIAIIDIIWETAQQETPITRCMLKRASDYPKDPEVEALVNTHNMTTRVLDYAMVFRVPPGLALSSKGMRVRQTEMGSFILNHVRDILSVDVALLCGGNIRADREYGDTQVFTFSHLKAELPFDTPITVVLLPGRVVAEMVTYTRAFALQDPPVVKGCFMQFDDGVSWDSEANVVTKVAYEALDPDRMYRVAINSMTLEGIDSVEPLLAYARDSQDAESDAANLSAGESLGCAGGPYPFHAAKTNTLELRNVLVAYFTKEAVFDLLDSSSFSALDSAGSGFLQWLDLERGMESMGIHTDVSLLTLHNLMYLADKSQLHRLSQEDALEICLGVWAFKANREADIRERDVVLSRADIVCLAKRFIGASVEQSLVDHVLAKYDIEGQGTVRRARLAAMLLSKADIDAVVT